MCSSDLFSLINSKFELSSSSFKGGSIEEVKIGGISIPFLITKCIDEENENLADLYVSVQSILSLKKERKIEKKPRVIFD